MSTSRVGFIMEQTLGSVTHYMNLRRHAAEARGFNPEWAEVEFEPSYLPWAFHGSLKARRAIAELFDRVDGLFVHTTTISLLSGAYFRRKPFILSTDGTPANKRAMREWYGLEPQGPLAAHLKNQLYRRAFRAAAGFIAWCEWAKASLVADYGCDEDAVCVIPPGIDLDAFRPVERSRRLPRILFVGADFERKGGELVRRVFQERLRHRAELVLVTSAPVTAGDNVEVHRSVKPNSPELRRLYAGSEIFALPTRADCLPLACMEALASGTAVVASRIGGIPDLIRDGTTGFLVSPDDALGLARALERLVEDAELRRTMGRRAREDAERRFDARTNARRVFDFVGQRLRIGGAVAPAAGSPT